MADFAITFDSQEGQDACALCGKGVTLAAGPRLVRADSLAPVCRECGKQHAPPLAALLDLTQIAERVGCISRHTLVPPLEALLDLAHAADGFTEAASVRKTKVPRLRALAHSAAS
jgi:hypothetical protein